MTVDVAGIVTALRQVVGNRPGDVALHEPRFAGREWECVKECIDTGWVSTAGSYVGEFEKRIANACGVEHAIAVVNGTAALHLALMIAGVKAGDEVIVPALTFAATANAVSHAGATPHLVDSELATLGIDPGKLDEHLGTTCRPGEHGPVNRKTGRRIAAIVPMHTFGHPVDMDRLGEVASRHRIPIVEDAAEALGSTYKGRPAGSLGRLAAVSFNGNKIVTTGGGGAILTNDAAIARRARHIATTAKRPHRWEFDHDEVGYNYRMPNINAALGCAQMEQLDGFLAAKRSLAERYIEAFARVPGVHMFREPPFAHSNYWLNTLLLDEPSEQDRDMVLAATNDAGLATRPVWKLMHHLPMYAASPHSDLSVAENLARRIVNLPSSAVLGLG
jgi:perosamine synthetase